MISAKQLTDIVAKLLVKAKAGEVRWQDESIDETKTFTVQFKQSKLYVQYSSPPTELDEIEIGIENSEGDTLKRLVVEEDENDPNWLLFFDLYQEAERTVTGSDRVLSEIEEELQKEGAIGLS
jgi:hypothetical protein